MRRFIEGQFASAQLSSTLWRRSCHSLIFRKLRIVWQAIEILRREPPIHQHICHSLSIWLDTPAIYSTMQDTTWSALCVPSMSESLSLVERSSSRCARFYRALSLLDLVSHSSSLPLFCLQSSLWVDSTRWRSTYCYDRFVPKSFPVVILFCPTLHWLSTHPHLQLSKYSQIFRKLTAAPLSLAKSYFHPSTKTQLFRISSC